CSADLGVAGHVQHCLLVKPARFQLSSAGVPGTWGTPQRGGMLGLAQHGCGAGAGDRIGGSILAGSSTAVIASAGVARAELIFLGVTSPWGAVVTGSRRSARALRDGHGGFVLGALADQAVSAFSGEVVDAPTGIFLQPHPGP